MPLCVHTPIYTQNVLLSLQPQDTDHAHAHARTHAHTHTHTYDSHTRRYGLWAVRAALPHQKRDPPHTDTPLSQLQAHIRPYGLVEFTMFLYNIWKILCAHPSLYLLHTLARRNERTHSHTHTCGQHIWRKDCADPSDRAQPSYRPAAASGSIPLSCL